MMMYIQQFLIKYTMISKDKGMKNYEKHIENFMYRHFGNNTYECCIVNTDSPDWKYHWNYIISCNGGRLVYTGQKISLVIKKR